MLKYRRARMAAAGRRGDVGITEYATEQLGIVVVELPEEGSPSPRATRWGDDRIGQGRERHRGAARDGVITEVNPAIVTNPALVNEGPAGRRLVLQDEALVFPGYRARDKRVNRSAGAMS